MSRLGYSPGDAIGNSPLTNLVKQGKLFVAGKAQTATLNDRYKARLVNPISSGKIVNVVAMSFYSTAATQVRFRKNSTSIGTETQAGSFNLNMASALTPSAQFFFALSTTDFTGGTLLDNESRVTPEDSLLLQFPGLIMAPGQNLALATATLSAGVVMTGNVYWTETAL